MRSGPLGQVLPFFIGVGVFFFPFVTYASVEITKVFYDAPGADAGKEWIQITNTGPGAVDVGGFRLLEAGVHHKLKVVQGIALLAPGTSAIIADNASQYLADTPGYSGTLFDSAFSLSNDGEMLVLKTSTGEVAHAYSYTAPPAPQKTTPTKSTSSTSSTKATKVEPMGTTSPSATRVVFEKEGEQGAAAGFIPKTSIAVGAWIAGLLCLMALGIVGVMVVRQERKREEETSSEAEEFTIVEK